MSTPNDLQSLLANIRPRPSPAGNASGQDSRLPQYPLQYQQGLRQSQQPLPYDGQSFPHPQFQQHGYRHPSVASIYSPSPVNTPPHNGSDIISPTVLTPRVEGQLQLQQPQPNPDRAASLLNLLKFNQAAQAPQQISVAPPTQPKPSSGQETGPASNPHGGSLSASDLVASLFGVQGPAPSAPTPAVQPATSLADQPTRTGLGDGSSAHPARAADNTQEMLLQLLNRSKPAQEQPEKNAVSQGLASPKRSHFETQDSSLQHTEPSSNVPGPEKPTASSLQQTTKESIFTYVNPFEQLAAISPRNRIPQPKSRSASPAVELAKSKKPSISTNVEPEAVTKPSAELEAKVFSESHVGSVEAPKELSAVDQTDRDDNKTVDKVTKEESSSLTPSQKFDSKTAFSSLSSQTQSAASEMKEPSGESAKAHTNGASATASMKGDSAKEPTNGAADGLADSWESAEDSAAKEEERVVPVYNFPIRPFITITVRANTGKIVSLRDDGIMDIARLKKDFDQLDRSLTSATSEYIVYALVKSGGMRIIRQDDGSDKQIFRSSRDRIFNVALCTSSPAAGATRDQAILGIGVSGTVYWAMISRSDKDLFELDALESESLVFPPFPASDENTSGGQLKTRAKRSARHPEFFAIGRGKNIYVVSPQAAMNSIYNVSGVQRIVNTEKFLKERALKISTGKAGKDFVFSEDDTVIASLDKTGRLRFWDIREAVTNPEFFSASGGAQFEVHIPLNTFVTGSPTEKSWPTSVLFIDKLRPHVKATALRYVLVGLKQNHTLQLWDIGLGRAVQEIRFPHENESDAICSVAYHPGSGIIVVGHPTRNSIYFLHLSAPRYNLQPMSQASFVKRSSERDSDLPRPESTACLSGVREISFASKGQLRSLDLLPITKTPSDKRGVDEDNGLFELYVMHSRGVTCLNIKKEDLGWSADNKIIRPVNALEDGFIEIVELQTFPSPASEEPSVNGDTASTPSKGAARETPKKVSELNVEPVTVPSASRNVSPAKPQLMKKAVEEQSEATPIPTSDKPEKKKKKKVAVTGEAVSRVKETGTATPSELAPDFRPTSCTHPIKDSAKEQPTISGIKPTTMDSSQPYLEPPTAGGSSSQWNKHFEDLQSSVFGEFNKSLGREFEELFRRFDEERRAWDAGAIAKQDQILRLVSSTLSDNVEKNLARIVENCIQSQVVPAISSLTAGAVGRQLNDAISQHLSGVIPRELRRVLPDAVARAVQLPESTKSVSDVVAQKLASQIESELSSSLHSTIGPALNAATQRSVEKVGSNLEKQLQAQLKHYEAQRHNDSAKIDKLTTLVGSLSDTVSSMAAAQASFQNEILRLNRILSSQQAEDGKLALHQSTAPASAHPREVPRQRTPEEIELAEISQLMNEGRYEEGSVRWLQSTQQADLFDNLFVRLNPAYLTGLSPIVALSVGVAVTSSLQTNIAERLAWLEVVLQTIDLRDPDIREVAPKIMDILTQRLESLYMTIAENTPHDPILRKIPPLSRRARELRGHQ